MFSQSKRNGSCHRCRKRKLKCDGQRPCRACVRLSKPNPPACTYDGDLNLHFPLQISQIGESSHAVIPDSDPHHGRGFSRYSSVSMSPATDTEPGDEALYDYGPSQERSQSRNSFSSFIRSASSSIRQMSVGSRSSTSIASQASASSRPSVKEIGQLNDKASRGGRHNKIRRQTSAIVHRDADGLGSILSKILSQFRRRKEDTQKGKAEDTEDLFDPQEDLSIETEGQAKFSGEEEIHGISVLRDSPRNTLSSSMSIEEVIAILNEHQCRDLTGDLDTETCSSLPIRGGGFGDVYRGRLRDGSQVAIKCTRLFIDSDERNRSALKDVARELYIWSKCKHVNIARLLGVAQFRNQIAMVSCWMENGALPTYLNDNKLQPDQKERLSMQVASGVEHIHELGIVHGDIRGANVLISERGDAKLTDFGNSTLKNHALQYSGASFKPDYSLRWAAPEIIKGDQISSKEGDIYAFGMTILEILTGDIPYAGKNDYAIVYLVTVKKESPPLPDSISNWISILLGRCWAHDLDKRPTAKHIMWHFHIFVYGVFATVDA